MAAVVTLGEATMCAAEMIGKMLVRINDNGVYVAMIGHHAVTIDDKLIGAAPLRIILQDRLQIQHFFFYRIEQESWVVNFPNQVESGLEGE